MDLKFRPLAEALLPARAAGRVGFSQEGSSEQVSQALVEDQTHKYIWAEQNGVDWIKNNAE